MYQMPRGRIITCLVADPTGKTETELVKGAGSSWGDPSWQCEKWDCLARGNCLSALESAGLTVYHPLKVELRTLDEIHGVVLCQGGGRAQRRK